MATENLVQLFSTNGFLLLLLSFAYWHIHKQLVKGDHQHQNLRLMYILLFLLILFDTGVVFTHNYISDDSLLILLKILLFFQATIFQTIGFAWYLYVWRIAKPKISIKTNYIVITSLLVLTTILNAVSLIPGANIFFSFTELDQAGLGNLHWIYIILAILPYVFSLIVNFVKWKEAKQRYNPFIIFLIGMIPLLSFSFQYIFAYYHLYLAGIILTFAVVVFDLQYHYAITDFLTGLYNRRNLIKYLTSTMANIGEDEVCAGFMLDINNFKSINDHFGHGFGDQVLIDISNLLLQMVSRGNYVARFGGDEFVVIAKIYDEIDIESIRQKIVKACDSYNEKNKNTQTITFSIGIATFKLGDDYTSSKFLELIDQRMYVDKQIYKENNNKPQ